MHAIIAQRPSAARSNCPLCGCLLTKASTREGHAEGCRAALHMTIAADAGRTASVYERSRVQAAFVWEGAGYRWNLEEEAGGPIDAPDSIPAGSTHAVRYLRAPANSIPAQSLANRDA